MTRLIGTAGPNVIHGGSGADFIDGKGGNDKLYGGPGSDELIGGHGHDMLWGGPGADYFDFGGYKSDLLPANVDTIMDFQPGIDQIILDYRVFKGMGFGPLKAQYFHVGPHATTHTQHIIYNHATGALYYDRDGSGPAPQQEFAVLHDRPEVPLNFIFMSLVFDQLLP